MTNQSTGRKVFFHKEQFGKPKSHSVDPWIMKIVPGLPELMKNAIHLESASEKKPEKYSNIRAWHTYGARAVLDGQSLYVQLTTF